MRIALVSCDEALDIDEDLPPLAAALRRRGAIVECVDWRGDHRWGRFDLVVLRSTWDYADQRTAFLAWAEEVATETTLLNPLEVVRWNTDKHYLADLAAAEVPVVDTQFVEPGTAGWRLPPGDEVVVKPAVGAGSRDAARHRRSDEMAIRLHVERLLDAGRSVLVQPYLARVDTAGETAIVCFGGEVSHALRKGPLLRRGAGFVQGLFAEEDVAPRTATPAELEVARRALDAVPHADPLPYARIDVLPDVSGQPVVLELELVEPSVFHAASPGSADRFADALLAHSSSA